MEKVFKKNLPPDFDIEGHRGCRGLLPENSIPAFINALELGVTTLEMDLVISKDQQVIVSHDPYFSHEISLSPTQEEISVLDERNFKIYQMNYEEIKKFDTGSKINSRFPDQKKIKVHKPLFTDVIDAAEKFIKENGLKPVQYNIEIKSTPEGDGIFHPSPEKFSNLVHNIIKEKNISDRTILQCFDLRPLQYFHKKYPSIKLSLLVENKLSHEFNTRLLGFIPDVYSPEYILIDKALMEFAKENHMKVIPWTVNNVEDIRKLINLGVDGIITDYPDLFE